MAEKLYQRNQCPGLSKTDIFNQMLDWGKRSFQNPMVSCIARFHIQNEEEGVIACIRRIHYIFFFSLSLDCTRIYYQLLINTKDGKCDLMMTRIRYWYDEARDGGENIQLKNGLQMIWL